ncbi:hypothetical protein, partial [Xanthomonas euvesicatoria]|uniref:hypothetical protein n=1 Tax=Xanthomonas euvesicatoria TaxID=456327 RepID=UPI0019CF8EF5
PSGTRVKRQLQALRACGAANVDAGYWTLTHLPQHSQLYQLDVTTYRPDKYVLLNTDDGSAWRGDITTPRASVVGIEQDVLVRPVGGHVELIELAVLWQVCQRPITCVNIRRAAGAQSL